MRKALSQAHLVSDSKVETRTNGGNLASSSGESNESNEILHD